LGNAHLTPLIQKMFSMKMIFYLSLAISIIITISPVVESSHQSKVILCTKVGGKENLTQYNE
jgi:hypothetical protein